MLCSNAEWPLPGTIGTISHITSPPASWRWRQSQHASERTCPADAAHWWLVGTCTCAWSLSSAAKYSWAAQIIFNLTFTWTMLDSSPLHLSHLWGATVAASKINTTLLDGSWTGRHVAYKTCMSAQRTCSGVLRAWGDCQGRSSRAGTRRACQSWARKRRGWSSGGAIRPSPPYAASI